MNKGNLKAKMAVLLTLNKICQFRCGIPYACEDEKSQAKTENGYIQPAVAFIGYNKGQVTTLIINDQSGSRVGTVSDPELME